MDMRKLFATDKRAETEGRRLVLETVKTEAGEIDYDKSTWLLVARKGNALYKAFVQKLLEENQVMLKTKSPEAEALAQSIFKDAAAHHLLIGWSKTGIGYGDKANLSYSVENARILLEMDDFNTMIDTYAGEMANFRAEEVVKDAKNSKTT